MSQLTFTWWQLNIRFPLYQLESL